MKKNEKKIRNERGNRTDGLVLALLALQIFLFIIIIFLASTPFVGNAIAGLGTNNVTVTTLLNVGNVFPEIINVTINANVSTLDLTPNATTIVNVTIYARDYNGEGDIANITVTFFQNTSTFGAGNDNNTHYTNTSCIINTSYGDPYEVSSLCNIALQYYANAGTWNATATVTDNTSYSATDFDMIGVNSLLALGLPDSINYGTVNATLVSDEQIANVTNFGNVIVNLSLSGYGANLNDGNAMNCTLGSVKNISLMYERYNLTLTHTGGHTLAAFNLNYSNLTSTVAVRKFNLLSRQSEAGPYIDDTNSTYWRIYVPTGVAGTCAGKIVFGATVANGT